MKISNVLPGRSVPLLSRDCSHGCPCPPLRYFFHILIEPEPCVAYLQTILRKPFKPYSLIPLQLCRVAIAFFISSYHPSLDGTIVGLRVWFIFDQIADCLQIRDSSQQPLLLPSKAQAAALAETKAFELHPCQQRMPEEKSKIILIGFFLCSAIPLLPLSKIGSVLEKSPVGSSLPHLMQKLRPESLKQAGQPCFSESPSVRAGSAISQLTFYLKAQEIVLSVN